MRAAEVTVHEPLWQPLVRTALAASMGLDEDYFHHEVPTRDGSRADLVYVHARRVLVFELKVSPPGEALAALDSRALRQLRHYRDAADGVYLVTLGAPRHYSLVHDGACVRCDPLEAQPLPDGVGWIAFDLLSHAAHVLRPAPELRPKTEARCALLDAVLARLGRVQRQVQECRA